MNALNVSKSFVAATLLTLLPAFPVSAQVRLPATGDVVQCPVGPYMDGAAYIVECTPRWSGFMLPDPVVNGFTGLMFCSYDAKGHLCPEAANIDVRDHPAPLENGFLSCTADWGAHEDVLKFTCAQD
jgi:hypothetical protein